MPRLSLFFIASVSIYALQIPSVAQADESQEPDPKPNKITFKPSKLDFKNAMPCEQVEHFLNQAEGKEPDQSWHETEKIEDYEIRQLYNSYLNFTQNAENEEGRRVGLRSGTITGRVFEATFSRLLRVDQEAADLLARLLSDEEIYVPNGDSQLKLIELIKLYLHEDDELEFD